MAARLAASYLVHDDIAFLLASLRSFAGAGAAFVFVSRVPWHGQPGDWEAAARAAGEAGATVPGPGADCSQRRSRAGALSNK